MYINRASNVLYGNLPHLLLIIPIIIFDSAAEFKNWFNFCCYSSDINNAFIDNIHVVTTSYVLLALNDTEAENYLYDENYYDLKPK